MKCRRLGGSSASVVLALWLTGCAVTAPGPRETVETEARAFLDHYLETLETGRDEEVAALFCSDDRFAWFTDGALSYSTPEDVTAGMRRYADLTFRTEVSNVDVVGLTDGLASVRTNFVTHLTQQGRTVHRYGGVLTLLLERGPNDRRWTVLLGHTSTPGGPPRTDASTEAGS